MDNERLKLLFTPSSKFGPSIACRGVCETCNASSVYELYSDPVAVSVLRRLVCVSRACGRGGDPLSRPLARLASAHKPDLIGDTL